MEITTNEVNLKNAFESCAEDLASRGATQNQIVRAFTRVRELYGHFVNDRSLAASAHVDGCE